MKVHNSQDIANYLICIASKIGEPLTNMKLQKLLYYCYAWFLVEKDNKEELFSDPIEAWQYGPVIRSVYSSYSIFGADNIKFPLDAQGIEIKNIDLEQNRITDLIDKETADLISEVFNEYGNSTAIDLMKLSHYEKPWNTTYVDGMKKVIDRNVIFSFYKNQKQEMSKQNT